MSVCNQLSSVKISGNIFDHTGDILQLGGGGVAIAFECHRLGVISRASLTFVVRTVAGRHNEFTNNIVNGSGGIAFDDRGGGGSRCAAPGHLPYDFLFRVPFNSSAAWMKYPNLPTILSDEPCLAKYNNLSNNVLCGGSKLV